MKSVEKKKKYVHSVKGTMWGKNNLFCFRKMGEQFIEVVNDSQTT